MHSFSEGSKNNFDNDSLLFTEGSKQNLNCSLERVFLQFMLILCYYCTDTLTFRLVDGGLPTEGRVEIQVAGKWGTVCAADLHGTNAQHLLCQALGFS